MPVARLRGEVEHHWCKGGSGIRYPDLLIVGLAALPASYEGWGPDSRQAMQNPLMDIVLSPAVRPSTKDECPRQGTPWVETWPLQKKGSEGLPRSAKHIHLGQSCPAPHECKGY
mgnify:CR=1 FL=1